MFLPTTTGLFFLDITDEFINKFGILLGAFVTVVALAWILRKLPMLQAHLDRVSSVRFGRAWAVLVGVVVPLVLGYILVNEVVTKIQKPYEGYPLGMLAIFGWGMAGLLIVGGALLAFTPWRRNVQTHVDEVELDAKYEEIMQK